MAFVGSLTTIILVLVGFSNRNKFILWMLILSIYFTATCMAATYVLGLFRIFPITMWRYIKPWGSITAMLIWWLGLSFFLAVLHLTHFGIWLQKKLDVHMLDQERFLSRECWAEHDWFMYCVASTWLCMRATYGGFCKYICTKNN